MYLSKLTLRNSSEAKKAMLDLLNNNTYAEHQLIWRLFPNDESRGFLFRKQFDSALPEFLVLSKSEPQQTNDVFAITTKVYAPKLTEGERLSYRLRANPTISVATQTGKRGKRHDVLMHAKKQLTEQQRQDPKLVERVCHQAARDWLTDDQRQQNWGLTLVTQPEIVQVKQELGSKKKANISYTSVDYQGILQVENPQILLDSVSNGLGASKAFGCGLMLLKRL